MRAVASKLLKEIRFTESRCDLLLVDYCFCTYPHNSLCFASSLINLTGMTDRRQHQMTNEIKVVYKPDDTDTADVVREVAKRALALIRESWSLEKPQDCRIYIMTSWWGFFFQSTPWIWRIGLAATLPLWSFRARRVWPYSAAWTQNYGRRVAIGIKPPRLLEVSDKSIGKLLYVEEKDSQAKLQQLTCHELTHACSVQLKLPAWLNEGLAMVTVDRFLGKQTIRDDTLEVIGSFKPRGRPPSYRQQSRLSAEAIAYHTAIGYWIVRYLEEVHPGFLKQKMTSHIASQTWDYEISAVLGIEPGVFWSTIPDVLIAHFNKTK